MLGGSYSNREYTRRSYDGVRFAFAARPGARSPGNGELLRIHQDELSLEGNTFKANCSSNTQANAEAL